METTTETTIRGKPVHTRSDTDAAIAAWLACTLKVPSAAQQEWTDNHVAMLPLGGLFDAVRIPAQLVHAAAGTSVPDTVAGFLAEVLEEGPVIHDPQVWFYALVPPRTSATWRSPVARCLGRGSWLGVPRVGDFTAGLGPYWAVPMVAAGELCSPREVAELIAFGHDRIAPDRSVSEVCGWCHELTQKPILAGIEHASSGAGRNVYACPPCKVKYQIIPLAEHPPHSTGAPRYAPVGARPQFPASAAGSLAGPWPKRGQVTPEGATPTPGGNT